MVSQKVVIKNPTGLHLRPAGIFCNRVRNTTANAKSVLSVLGSCVKAGDEIEIICSGPDEAEALEAMVLAVKNGLGE